MKEAKPKAGLGSSPSQSLLNTIEQPVSTQASSDKPVSVAKPKK
jgi:hypothetical protein